MPRRKPPITANWLPVVSVKGCPNILSSKYMVADLRKRREEAGITAKMDSYCWFCGRPFKRSQAYLGHMRHCDKRRIYHQTMRDGFTFRIGTTEIRIVTNRWAWLVEAERIEAEANRQIAAGLITEADAVKSFRWFCYGLAAAHPGANVIPIAPAADPAAGET